MDFHRALSKAAAGRQYIATGETLAGVTMLDGSAKPTQAEIDTAWTEIQTEDTQENSLQTAIKNALADLKNGTGTAAERLARIERALHWVMRRMMT